MISFKGDLVYYFNLKIGKIIETQQGKHLIVAKTNCTIYYKLNALTLPNDIIAYIINNKFNAITFTINNTPKTVKVKVIKELMAIADCHIYGNYRWLRVGQTCIPIYLISNNKFHTVHNFTIEIDRVGGFYGNWKERLYGKG